MMWPGDSADLNQIEHLWDQQKRSVYRRFEEYSTLADLAQLLQQEWMAISQRRVGRRCLEVIEKRGGYTRY
jgi:transposase